MNFFWVKVKVTVNFTQSFQLQLLLSYWKYHCFLAQCLFCVCFSFRTNDPEPPICYYAEKAVKQKDRQNLTRSSAVAVIADRTAYDVRYTNRFRLQIDERLVRTIQSNKYRVE